MATIFISQGQSPSTTILLSDPTTLVVNAAVSILAAAHTTDAFRGAVTISAATLSASTARPGLAGAVSTATKLIGAAFSKSAPLGSVSTSAKALGAAFSKSAFTGSASISAGTAGTSFARSAFTGATSAAARLASAASHRLLMAGQGTLFAFQKIGGTASAIGTALSGSTTITARLASAATQKVGTSAIVIAALAVRLGSVASATSSFAGHVSAGLRSAAFAFVRAIGPVSSGEIPSFIPGFKVPKFVRDFIYERTITIRRPPSETAIGLITYHSMLPETIVATDVQCSIQPKGAGRIRGMGLLPSDAPGPAQWQILIPLDGIGKDQIRDADILVDDLGYRYQVSQAGWSPLGYDIYAIRLET